MNSRRESIIPLDPPRMDERLAPADDPGVLAQLGRRLLFARLATMRDGELIIEEWNGQRHRFGRRTPRLDLTVTLQVDHPQLYADAAFGGTVGAGEAYI
ncbi:MAG: hypothetical protein ACKODA_07770, partial [Nevskiaceae bacterium]